mmetsp:Transcript_12556/g.35281  ORF Transcript_12556/g.35281 Transcript_12556/m.35281 type:complete len:97 (-) Transcript_12556:215-505(-)
MDTSGPCLPLMLLSYAHCSPDPNSFVSGNPGSPPPPRQQVRSVQKEIRQQERVLLDVFSTTNFMKAGAGVAVVMLFVFIFVIGPPPSDGRCALPWC